MHCIKCIFLLDKHIDWVGTVTSVERIPRWNMTSGNIYKKYIIWLNLWCDSSTSLKIFSFFLFSFTNGKDSHSFVQKQCWLKYLPLNGTMWTMFELTFFHQEKICNLTTKTHHGKNKKSSLSAQEKHLKCFYCALSERNGFYCQKKYQNWQRCFFCNSCSVYI